MYNVITQPKTSIQQIVTIASEYLNREISVFNASAEFLTENKIAQWVDMPLWINGDHFTYSNQKMKHELLRNPSDFKSCIENTIDYYDQLNWPKPKYGLSEVKKDALLKELSK